MLSESTGLSNSVLVLFSLFSSCSSDCVICFIFRLTYSFFFPPKSDMMLGVSNEFFISFFPNVNFLFDFYYAYLSKKYFPSGRSLLYFFQFCKCGFPKFFEHVCNSYFEAIVQSNFWALSPIFYPTGDSFHHVLFYPLYASQFPVTLRVKISLTNIATWYHDSSVPSPSVIVRVLAFVCSVTFQD